MNTLVNEFKKGWTELKDAVLKKYPTSKDCSDFVEFLMNSGLSKLEQSQLDKVAHFRDISSIITEGTPVEGTESAIISREDIDILKDIRESI